jgi:hypothetical protein
VGDVHGMRVDVHEGVVHGGFCLDTDLQGKFLLHADLLEFTGGN